MSAGFDIAWHWILAAEGGYSNDGDDPGGETMYGISRRYHPEAWVNGPPTEDEARAIYKRFYWDRNKCDRLPAQLAIALFDAAVNHSDSASLFQRSLGAHEDGIVGDDTIEAANRLIPEEVLTDFLSWRAMHYCATKGRFRRGLFKRLFRLQRALISMFA